MSIHTMSEVEWRTILHYENEVHLKECYYYQLYLLFERLNILPTIARRIDWSIASIAMQIHCVRNSYELLQEFIHRKEIV